MTHKGWLGGCGWVLVNPKGEPYVTTFRATRVDCWLMGFWVLCSEQGEEWKNRFWKRWQPSIASAQRLGYRIRKARILPL